MTSGTNGRFNYIYNIDTNEYGCSLPVFLLSVACDRYISVFIDECCDQLLVCFAEATVTCLNLCN